MDFALLNNDSLWVLDEIQLMGDALKTSTQLQGFRNIMGTMGITQSIWMSATVSCKSVQSVDYNQESKILSIGDDDLKNQSLSKIYHAVKELHYSPAYIEDINAVSDFILEKHKNNTIIIVNTVSRLCM